MRILFIKCFRADDQHFVVTHPLGPMYLASFLRQHGDYEFKIIDMRLNEYRDPDTVVGIAREFNPDLIGFSALTIEAPCLYDTLGRLRPHFPDTPMVVGGPHPSSATERCLKDGPVDLAVIGEGELTMLDIVRALEEGRPLREIPGTAWLDDQGEVVKASPREAIEDLDALPFPAWDLIPALEYSEYWRFSQLGTRPYMSLFTSRACPYKCIYCHDLFGKTFRARSVPNIIAEIKELDRLYGIRAFEIVDDIFNFNRQRVREFCAAVKAARLDIQFTFPNGLRTDILDKELVELLADAGCTMIAFAVESASERIQKMIRKYNRIDKIHENIRHAANAGIFCHGYFMIGFPTETLEEMQATLDCAVNSDLHTAGMFIANPFEGTELARMAREKGLEVDLTYNDYGYYETRFNMSAVPDQDLRELVRGATKRFYLQPRRVYRILRDHPTKAILPGQFVHLIRRSFDFRGLLARIFPPTRSLPAAAAAD